MNWLLVWRSGHEVPVRIYFCRTEGGWVACTVDREEAMRFPTKEAAERQWLAMHAFPEDYVKCLVNGSAWAEAEDQPALFVSRDVGQVMGGRVRGVKRARCRRGGPPRPTGGARAG